MHEYERHIYQHAHSYYKQIRVIAVVKVEILRWGNCTCTLGPPLSACGPLVDSSQLCPRLSLNRRVVFIY